MSDFMTKNSWICAGLLLVMGLLTGCSNATSSSAPVTSGPPKSGEPKSNAGKGALENPPPP